MPLEPTSDRQLESENFARDAAENSLELLHTAAQRCLPKQLRSKMDSWDLAHEAWIHAWERCEQFRGKTPAEFHAWLKQILRRRAEDIRRQFQETQKRQLEREIPLESVTAGSQRRRPVVDPHPTPGTRVAAREIISYLDDCLDQLSADHRTVLKLRHWDRKSFAEIGEAMGRSPEAARKLWTRAIEQLRSLLARAMQTGGGPSS